MNYSRYVTYVPYRLAWGVGRLYRRLFHRPQSVLFYCCSIVDYVVFKNIHKHLPHVRLIAESRQLRKELSATQGITDCGLYPAFPDVVLMARHIARKFPGPNLIKIGMRHGAYHFKAFVSAERYNEFDKFLVTSRAEVELARQAGITSAVAVGFPKLDGAFDGTLTEAVLKQYRRQLDLDDTKRTIIFAATWDRSGMSAVHKWSHRLAELTDAYNILVTLHPWISDTYSRRIRETDKIHYLKELDNLPYLMISDLMVSDTSSIIAEFCALDKPIVTYRIEAGPRLTQEIQDMLEAISYPVDTFEEMKLQITRALEHPAELSASRQKYNRIMFDELDGRAGERAAAIIKEYLRVDPASGAGSHTA